METASRINSVQCECPICEYDLYLAEAFLCQNVINLIEAEV